MILNPKAKKIQNLFLLVLAGILITQCRTDNQSSTFEFTDLSEIHPDPMTGYWKYKGETVILLGGSSEDNLFQVEDVESELEVLKSVGGNYVRCTMSSRDKGNAWPFEKSEDGLYDLHKLNPVYWQKLDSFLKHAEDRDIIVQLELWATFDFYRDNWDVNPFNPINNVNYTERRSKLAPEVSTHPIFTENNFFRSVPSQMALAPVLDAQQRFVDALLDITLKYDNILYCMDNETSVTSDWGKFWAAYIKEKGQERGVFVNTTEMWDPWELGHPFHAETYNNPDYFNFVDISQNNHQTGDDHWENGLYTINKIRNKSIRPINNVKIYGNDGGRHKTTRDGIENFIQNVLMGCSSARFHRPTSGQGLNETARSVIKSMRMLVDNIELEKGVADNSVLTNRIKGQHYCRYIEGQEYVIYFSRQGKVGIDLSAQNGNFQIRWLKITDSEWLIQDQIKGGDIAMLNTPGKGHWIALITR